MNVATTPNAGMGGTGWTLFACVALAGCIEAPESFGEYSASLSGAQGIQANGTMNGDEFGGSVSLSGDGTRLAVGAEGETSCTTGVNNPPMPFCHPFSGAAYVFTKTNGSWVQEAFVKPDPEVPYAYFGYHLALSRDGSTLAVGAIGIGVAYVFARTPSGWSQQARLTENRGGNFGFRVSLADGGDTLAVSAPGETGPEPGLYDEGAVYVYDRKGQNWSLQAALRAPNADYQDMFGHSVSLSGDGATLAVGAANESSSASGLNGDMLDNSAPAAGAVYVFTRQKKKWMFKSYLKASNPNSGDTFGAWSIALSQDASALLVGAASEASNGLGGELDNSLPYAGAAYLFERTTNGWNQTAYIKASNPDSYDEFGFSLALSSSTAVIGANAESSNAVGINGDQLDNSAPNAGAAYAFSHAAGVTQTAYLKSNNTTQYGQFGRSVATTTNGAIISVGQPNPNGGVVYVFE